MHESSIPSSWSKQMPETLAGTLTVFVSKNGLREIVFGKLPEALPEDPAVNELLNQVITQLEEYFSGQRKVFGLQLDWSGMSDFQTAVLRACYAIPYGQVRTYAGLARETGKPKAARAVGNIMAANPLPIVIPCHRVIGSDGSLHGYGGGLDVKARLLKMEGARLAA